MGVGEDISEVGVGIEIACVGVGVTGVGVEVVGVGVAASTEQLIEFKLTDHSECLLMMSCRELPTLCVEYRRVLF